MNYFSSYHYSLLHFSYLCPCSQLWEVQKSYFCPIRSCSSTRALKTIKPIERSTWDHRCCKKADPHGRDLWTWCPATINSHHHHLSPDPPPTQGHEDTPKESLLEDFRIGYHFAISQYTCISEYLFVLGKWGRSIYDRLRYLGRRLGLVASGQTSCPSMEGAKARRKL